MPAPSSGVDQASSKVLKWASTKSITLALSESSFFVEQAVKVPIANNKRTTMEGEVRRLIFLYHPVLSAVVG